MTKRKAAKKTARTKRRKTRAGIAQDVTFLIMTIAYDQTVREKYLQSGSWPQFCSWLLGYLKSSDDQAAVKRLLALCNFLMPVPSGQSASMTDKINQTLEQQGVISEPGDIIEIPVMRPNSWPVRK